MAPCPSRGLPGSFTQQEPIPEAGIAAALAVMRHGRLHRYNTLPGERPRRGAGGRIRRLHRGALLPGVASGGYAMGCALRASGCRPATGPDQRLHAGPGAGRHRRGGARPVFVEITTEAWSSTLTIWPRQAADRRAVLLLSHMRGHVCDMDAADGDVRCRWGAGDRGLRPYDGGKLARRAVGAAWGDGLLFHADLQAYEFWRGRADRSPTIRAGWRGRSCCREATCCMVATGPHRRPEVFEEVRWRRRTSRGGWTTCARRSCGRSLRSGRQVARWNALYAGRWRRGWQARRACG
jgi:hypothetical protein